MGTQNRTVERLMAQLAQGSHGVVTRRALLAAGLTPRQIGLRVRSGALIKVHDGIYRVGHAAPNADATYLAAVLACGHGAGLDGLAAAHSLGLRRGSPPRPEVLAPRECRVRGVISHRARAGMPPLIRWRGIPTVAVADVLVSVAGRLDDAALARFCHEAGVRHRTTAGEVRAATARRPSAAGAGRLRIVMEGDAKLVLSKLEAKFLSLLRAHGLPLPATNRKVGGRLVDCRWSTPPLTVELDSYRFHNSRLTWERDHARERQAYARGDQFRRYTWGDVFENPGPMLNELRLLLAPAGVRL